MDGTAALAGLDTPPQSQKLQANGARLILANRRPRCAWELAAAQGLLGSAGPDAAAPKGGPRLPAAYRSGAGEGPEERRLRPVFQVCGKDNKGYLIREDLKGIVVMFFGYEHLKVYPIEWKAVHASLLFEFFLNLLSAKKTAQLHSNETRQIFTAFDVQDKAFLTFEDFNRAFNSISPKLPEKIIVEAFREVDRDSDDCISFREFESAVKYGQNVVSPVYFA
ncbi:EF-hand calcium-binding domain-containing protein 11 [Melopsittacus undulatus]|uniref:EF-hand calcium-binding domain-containing protein 11 n=1 Tax=Melopsittacus undulatus TaxID=13146 RepID=UPI00146CF1DC|nr:EF-hand calcium-binding domain-containing protein 11 [Melopsittacus undulatus]